MRLPPGVQYILTSPSLFLAPLLLWLSRYALERYAEIDFYWIPVWLWPIALLSSPVAIFAARLQLDAFIDKQRARRLGAFEPPMVPGNWPGYVDIVYKMFQRDGIAYLGMCLCSPVTPTLR